MKGHDTKPRALLFTREYVLHILSSSNALLAGAFFLLFITTLIAFFYLGQNQYSDKINESQIQIVPNENSNSLIAVDIQGAIEAPGVYELPEESRLIELLKKAKGLSKNADRYYVAKTFNLSKKLTDEEKIYIPFITEANYQPHSEINQLKISINNGTQTQLELLPSVGEKTAIKIINNRPYASLDELVNKKAIGEALYKKIESLISL